MKYKSEILKLRRQVPIPLSEAMTLLEENEGDVETCVYLYKAKCIREIIAATDCTEEMAMEAYKAEKYDINKSISTVKEEVYDLNYKPIEGLNMPLLSNISEWISLNEDKDFPTSLDYMYIFKTIEALRLIGFDETATILDKSLWRKKQIFEGYSDSLPMEEFVRRHQQLDNDLEFQTHYSHCQSMMLKVKEETTRHKRNILKQNQNLS